MKLHRLAVTALALGALVACSRIAGNGAAAGGRSAVAWEKDLTVALSRADSERKVVMVDFYTDWCGWCRKLDETTYADPAVQSTLKRLVTVKLDAERGGRADAERYRVEGFPCVLFLNAKGVEVARIPGYLPPGEFLEELKDVLSKA
jgi:thiol:disulfide interchange protein